MTDDAKTCGAGNVSALIHRLVGQFCTMPNDHLEWTVNPATGYSYNHCNVEDDEWWNDPGAPLWAMTP